MHIIGFVKTSTLDFPGQLSSVVFTAGCNYVCPWCHNLKLWDTQKEIRQTVILAYLEKRKGLLDGVVITGGEPTMQEGLIPFALEIKRMGFLVKLDTNGSNPGVVADMITNRAVDYIAMDYKAPWERYSQLCMGGADSNAVKETLALLKNSQAEYELRTTVLPELGFEELRNMAAAVHVLPRYALQLYRPAGGGSADPVKDESWIKNAAEKLRPLQPNIAARV